MTQSSRVLSGSVTKGSTMSESGSIKCFVQGVNIEDSNYRRPHPSIRANADTVLSVDNKRFDDSFKPFNDTDAPFRYGQQPVMVAVGHTGLTSSHLEVKSPYNVPGQPVSYGTKNNRFLVPGRDFTVQKYVGNILRTSTLGGTVEAEILHATSSLSFLDSNLVRTHNVFNHSPGPQDFGMGETIGNSERFTPFTDFGSHSRKEELSKEIIKYSDPNKEFLIPDVLTEIKSEVGTDGIVDPTMIRLEASRASTFWPILPRGAKGSFGVEEDAFYRNAIITDKIAMSGSSVTPFFDGSSYFAPDTLLTPSSSISSREINVLGPIPIQGIESADSPPIKPFVDDADDLKLRTQGLSGDAEIRNVLRRRNTGSAVLAELTNSGSLAADNDGLMRGEKYSSHGFDYADSEHGIDSIVYGGLKR